MTGNEPKSKLSTLSYGNLEILSPYELVSLRELKIVKRVNDHARIYLTGIIPEGKKDSYIKSSSKKDILEVKQVDNQSKGTHLFIGVVTRIGIKAVQGVYFLEIEGASCTLEMDILLKKRSFQNKDMLYEDLIKKVLQDYSDPDSIDTVSGGKNIENFIIQYNETDWEFLKRMAYRFNAGLVPDSSRDKPRFWFGMPAGEHKGKLEEYHYNVGKNTVEWIRSRQNQMKQVSFSMYYEVETSRLLNIGDRLTYQDKNLTVVQALTFIKDSVLRHLYTLTFGNELDFAPLPNPRMFKASVEGKVIDIKEDLVRVHLEIDEKQEKEEAYWFPYYTDHTSEGNTGGYCMPELNDHVKLYFPSCKEEEGFIIRSLRRKSVGGDKINNPDIKYFRTKHKKEEMFSEKELVFSAKDEKVFIRLDEEKGVEVLSDKDIQIKSDVDLIVKSDKISITAQEEMKMVCKESSIVMDGTTHFLGTTVKVRCR
ncbi:MAG: phage late control D family protein [Clostridia bacterium]|nr:phage late control D family protein [Clostridia bacterium]